MADRLLSIVVFGETGTGKSTLGNTLVGSNDGTLFSESSGVNAHTYETAAHTGNYFRQPVKVTDTPGLGESTDTDARHLVNMAQVVTADNTIRALVIVLNFQNPRFEDREKKLFDLVMKMFPGAPWYEHVAVVWTRFFSFMPQSMKDERYEREAGFKQKMIKYYGSIVQQEKLNRIPQFFVDSVEARKAGNESQRELNNLLAWVGTCKLLKEDMPAMRVAKGAPRTETQTRTEFGGTREETWSGGRRYGIAGPRSHHGRRYQTQTVIVEERSVQEMTDGTVDTTPWKEKSRSSREVCIASW